MNNELSAAQIQDREERTIFVGNVDLGAKRKHLKKFFTIYGEVEIVWLRSIPTETSKIPKKGCVVLEKVYFNSSSLPPYPF